MSAPKLTSKIFIPEHYLNAPSGYIVGWNVRSFVACIASIVSNVELSDLEQILENMAETDIVRNSPCGPPVVLGEWIVQPSERKTEEEEDINNNGNGSQGNEKQKSNNKINDESIWIVIDKEDNSKYPFLREIYCYGYRYQTSAQVVIYSQPTPEHFFWPDPINLDLESYKKTNENAQTKNLLNLNLNSSDQFTELEEALQQVNISAKIEKLLMDSLDHHVKSEGRSRHFPESPRAKLVDSISWMLNSPLFYLSFFYLSFAQEAIKFLNYKIPFFNQTLVDLTVTGRHVDSRIRLILSWKTKYQLLNEHWKRNTPEARANYVNFYNEVWLVMNDIFFGLLVGALLLYFRDPIIIKVHNWNDFLSNAVLKAQIGWLMGWPAGFKLNDNLDEFLGVVFLFYIDRWNEVVQWFDPFQPFIIQVVALSGFIGGLSLIISLGMDILSFFTFHIYCFYTASARIYLLQLNVLSSLWKLFRGKKYNPLKDRIDSCDFNVDQLLLGTLLFTSMFFLLPTTGIYYIFFTFVRIFLTAIKTNFIFVLDLLQLFPLYPAVLYFVDNTFLPGGIWFEIMMPSQEKEKKIQYGIIDMLKMLFGNSAKSQSSQKSRSKEKSETKGSSTLSSSAPVRKTHTYLILHNRTLPFGALFFRIIRCIQPLFKKSTWKNLFT